MHPRFHSTQVVAHTDADVQETLQPISRILSEVGDDERALFVLREWCGVSAAPAAREAFCKALEASPAGVESLEFTMLSKGHWCHHLDRRTFERIVALSVEDRRRAMVLRVNLKGHKLEGAQSGPWPPPPLSSPSPPPSAPLALPSAPSCPVRPPLCPAMPCLSFPLPRPALPPLPSLCPPVPLPYTSLFLNCDFSLFKLQVSYPRNLGIFLI